MNDNTRFFVAALGIFFSYFYFGIIQEKITRGKYGDAPNSDGSHGEKFTYALTLCGVQCLWNWIFAKGMSDVDRISSASNRTSFAAILIAKPQKEDKTHFGYYASSALTYLLAMVSSNMALRWVPYPTQVIGKSAKPIPVMLLGVLIGRKSYSLQRYLFVFLIVVGVVLFMLKDAKPGAAAVHEGVIGIGEVLLFLSLSMDGLTGAIQERMRAATSPSALHMMLAMNWWSTVILGVGVVLTGEIFDFIAFAGRHPHVLFQLATLAITGALGQLFIFIMVCFV